MSNDSPFVAPGNDAGAPLQAPPAAQAEVPPFGSASIAPPAAAGAAQASAAQPAFGSPAPGFPAAYSGIPAAPPQPLSANRAMPVAMAILAVAYVALCLVELFELTHRISLIKQLTGDADADAGLLNQIDSAAHTENALSWVALFVFLSIMIVLSVWLRRLRTTWSPTGRYQQLLKESGYQVFRIIWLISFAFSLFLRGNGPENGPQDAINRDHELMVYFGIRAVLGVVLIYFAVRFARVSARILTLSQAGYSQDAVNYLSS